MENGFLYENVNIKPESVGFLNTFDFPPDPNLTPYLSEGYYCQLRHTVRSDCR